MRSAPRAKEAQPEAAAALEFLRQWAPGELYRAANDALDTSASASTYLARLAGILDRYVDACESGLLTDLPYEVRSRVEAATDLMEQVELLLTDPGLHAAAPVVLAGAALEETLRSMWHLIDEPQLSGKPGISAYAAALKAAGVIDRQDVKDITSWAGIRNDAAHGFFDSIDLAHARHMVDGVNLFMQRKSPRSP